MNLESGENTITLKDDVSADTQVLLSTIDGMMKIIQTQADLYNDTRKRLVQEHTKKPNLSISEADSFFIEPGYTGPDLKLLGQKLGLLGARLKQMGEEKTNAQAQTEKAFKQLNDENLNLREELTRLRKILYPPSKCENASNISNVSKSVEQE